MKTNGKKNRPEPTPAPEVAGQWRNRIVGSGTADPNTLLANPKNWRLHPEEQQAALSSVLDKVGWVQNVIVNKRTGYVLDGHLRLMLAVEKNERTIPVVYVDLTAAEEAAVLATFDPVAAMAGCDENKLRALLAEVDEMLPEVVMAVSDQTGVEFGENGTADAEAQIDRAAELNKKWQVKTGDLWRIGEHRLLCGDSTKREDVQRVMGGEKAEMVLTDPPYGIDWDTDYTRFTTEYGTKRVKHPPISNDDKEFDPRPWLEFPQVILFGANWFCKHIPVGSWLIWDKRHPNGTAWLSDAEIAWMKGKRGVYIYAETVQGAHRKETAQHPTQKPVGLMKWCIEKSDDSQIILDPFLGSGTTMVACENLGRKCRGIEISPDYCAVILERMQTAFPKLTIERVKK